MRGTETQRHACCWRFRPHRCGGFPRPGEGAVEGCSLLERIPSSSRLSPGVPCGRVTVSLNAVPPGAAHSGSLRTFCRVRSSVHTPPHRSPAWPLPAQRRELPLQSHSHAVTCPGTRPRAELLAEGAIGGFTERFTGLGVYNADSSI